MRDWKPCVRDLLERLVSAGFAISEIDDGGDLIEFTTLDAAVDTITSVDESTVVTKDTQSNSEPVLLIVLGNGPDEIVADYGGCDLACGKRLGMILEGHSKDWEGREV
jgi:hypothetical protein